MNTFIIYLIQSSAILSLMFLVYWIFLRKETFFQLNRAFLLMSGFFSLVAPIIPFQKIMQEPVGSLAVFLEPVLITPDPSGLNFIADIQWPGSILVVYLTGLTIFSVRFFIQIIQMYILSRRSTVTKANNVRLILVDRRYAPFSFLNMIFINKSRIAPENLPAILAHEQVHVNQGHSIDLILTELLFIFQWFNPFTWLLNRELKNIHEYLADEGVIRQGINTADYQQIILNETIGVKVNSLTHNFNISQLKKRIIMMTQKRSGSWAAGKMMLALPVILGIGLIFSVSAISVNTIQNNQSKSQSSEKANQKDAQQLVEVQPSFPGGQDAMSKFLVEKIKYPVDAMKKNIMGTVYVSFTVETDGTLTDVKILKGIGSGCDEETIRVVKLMPKWVPGKAKGQPVKAQITLPVKFKLDDDKGKDKNPPEEKKK
jgi:TonB family protein